MIDYQKQVTDIIEQALTEKTFNLEIINKIKELRDEVIKLATELESKKEAYDLLCEQKTLIEEELNEIKVRLDTIDAREKKVAEKEKMQEKLEYSLQFQLERANEIKELFNIVFRNPVILKSKVTGHPYTVPSNSYPNTITTNDTEEQTTK